MIYRVIIALLLLAGAANAQQVIDMDTEHLYRKEYSDWITTPSDSGFAILTSQDTADTIESSAFPTEKGGGEIYVNARVAKMLGDSVNVALQLGLYRGEGVARSHGTDGWEWVTLDTFTDVGESEYILKNLSAVSEKPFSAYKFRWVETGDQKNEYVQWVHHYKAGGR